MEIWELDDLKEVVEKFKALEHENSTPRESSVQEKRSRNSSGSPEINRGQNHVVETTSKLAASAIGVEGSTIDFKQRLEVKEKEVSSVVLDERTRSPSLQSKVDNLIVDATKEKDSLTVSCLLTQNLFLMINCNKTQQSPLSNPERFLPDTYSETISKELAITVSQ